MSLFAVTREPVRAGRGKVAFEQPSMNYHAAFRPS